MANLPQGDTGKSRDLAGKAVGVGGKSIDHGDQTGTDIKHTSHIRPTLHNAQIAQVDQMVEMVVVGHRVPKMGTLTGRVAELA